MKHNSILDWAKRIDWDQRVKAICKPCWELNYCPYGILVEEFPLKTTRDEVSCRIYGHDCPVFHIAEPFTETRELRTISRNIPNSVKAKVLFRDRQVCQNCNSNIKDNEIHFDHVIPWSKGGSSDTSNIQLLCKDCNELKSNNFERDNLVYSFNEQTRRKVAIEFIMVFKDCANEKIRVKKDENRDILIDDILICLGATKKDNATKHALRTVNEIWDVLSNDKPKELTQKYFDPLKFRWGIEGENVKSIHETIEKFNLDGLELIKCELDLFRRLGMTLELNTKNINKWLKI